MNIDNSVLLYIILVFLILKFIVKDINLIFFIILSIIIVLIFNNIEKLSKFYNISENISKYTNKNISKNANEEIILDTKFEHLIDFLDKNNSNNYLVKYNLNSFLKTFDNINNKKIDLNMGLSDLNFLYNKIENYLENYDFKNTQNKTFEKNILVLKNTLKQYITKFDSNIIQPQNYYNF